MNQLPKVNRLEIIDHRPCNSCHGQRAANYLQKDGSYKEEPCHECGGLGSKGREVIFWNDRDKVELSFQDDDRTLKVFVSRKDEKTT